MSKARTTVECYTASCPEEVAKQCGAAYHQQRINAFTLEEIMEAVERPYGDREQPPDSDYMYLLTGASEDWEG